MKRRGNREGSIYKRKDGRWCGSVSLGSDYQTGKLLRKVVYGKTRQEASEKKGNPGFEQGRNRGAKPGLPAGEIPLSGAQNQGKLPYHPPSPGYPGRAQGMEKEVAGGEAALGRRLAGDRPGLPHLPPHPRTSPQLPPGIEGNLERSGPSPGHHHSLPAPYLCFPAPFPGRTPESGAGASGAFLHHHHPGCVFQGHSRAQGAVCQETGCSFSRKRGYECGVGGGILKGDFP